MRRYWSLTVIAIALQGLQAQDLRERNYYFETLNPGHEPKPQVEGYATERIAEHLTRGLIATPSPDGNGIHLSWRLLNADPDEVSFHVYRMADGKQKRLTRKAIREVCDYTDHTPSDKPMSYWVTAHDAKGKVIDTSEKLTVDKSLLTHYRSIKLRDPKMRVGKVAVADLNGDGIYDYIVRTPDSNVDPGMPGTLDGRTYQIEAYLSDGTFLWSKDLGQGIEPGVWYSPFIAYDFNGDGKAEVALKTAPETTKRNDKGRVDSGEEYLSVWDGMTGREIARVDWPERNDRYGNLVRQNRNQIGMAYLDGKTPYILACRGTYKLMVVDAWELRGEELVRAWRWDGDEENPIIRSMGAHSLVSGDVDNDGRDEILLGSCMIDDNGTALWSAGLGHPDKAYLTDIDPNRPGMEVYLCLEPFHTNGRGVCMVDARTGEQVWNIGHETKHVGNGMVADFDPSHPGLECFATEDKKGGSSDKYLLTADGKYIRRNENIPPCGGWVWWDGDLSREVLHTPYSREEMMELWRNGQPVAQHIVKWADKSSVAEGIEGSLQLIADLYGDWREEIVMSLPGELRIYTTNNPARDRRVTLMQDAIYRSYVAHRSMGYPQAPVPSYYLGE
ncbi:MAG: silent information regulator protein Sir2 [Bacteroidaceae bacterium]|nr:silent information regulator protein Sir2 [Bacteroidaceae bacterium]